MSEYNSRIAIYPKDVQTLTGKSLRWSQRKLNEIRKALDKKRKQIVTYEEFCKFMGILKIKEDIIKNG